MTPTDPTVDSKKSAHWTVRTNYRLRVGSFALVFASIAFHGYENGLHPVIWMLAALQLLVYPHVVYWLARRSANSQQAEVNNLTIDCLLFGLLAGALEFPLWITFNFYVASTLNITISRGVVGLLRSQLAFFSGALIVVALLGWHVTAATGLPATSLSVLGNIVYMAAIGIAAYRRNQQLRETREALRLRTTELSTTLAQLQQSQDSLLEAAKLASLGSLVAGVAHELNTPIGNALVTATAMDEESKNMAHQYTEGTMKRSALELFLGRSSEMSDLIVRSCQRAANLIVSFKKVAVDQASEQQRVFDLREVVADNLISITPSLKGARLELVNRVPASIVCDSYPGALGQVLAHIVQNAALHAFDADASGRLIVEASTNATHATLTVRDNGRGMQPDVVKHVFDPFFTTRLGQGGSGLGLTISRNIASGLLGGTLQVQSTVGQGSVFTIEFPLKALPARPMNVYQVTTQATGNRV